MWNISFKIYREGELHEEGFDTSYTYDIEVATIDAYMELDLEDADKIELVINKIKLK